MKRILLSSLLIACAVMLTACNQTTVEVSKEVKSDSSEDAPTREERKVMERAIGAIFARDIEGLEELVVKEEQEHVREGIFKMLYNNPEGVTEEDISYKVLITDIKKVETAFWHMPKDFEGDPYRYRVYVTVEKKGMDDGPFELIFGFVMTEEDGKTKIYNGAI